MRYIFIYARTPVPSRPFIHEFLFAKVVSEGGFVRYFYSFILYITLGWASIRETILRGGGGGGAGRDGSGGSSGSHVPLAFIYIVETVRDGKL